MFAASSGAPNRRMVYDDNIRLATSSFEVAAAIRAGVRGAERDGIGGDRETPHRFCDRARGSGRARLCATSRFPRVSGFLYKPASRKTARRDAELASPGAAGNTVDQQLAKALLRKGRAVYTASWNLRVKTEIPD